MKPAAFKYHKPRTLDEALSLLKSLPDAKVLAGGQSLVPMMNFRLVAPADLIDLNAIDRLSVIDATHDAISIGAMTRQRELEKNAAVYRYTPIFRDALSYVGHRQTRNRGTVGGSLCQLDPAAELVVLAVLHDARLTLVSLGATRDVSIHDFILGAMAPALHHDEILTRVTFPIATTGVRVANFLEHSQRRGDFAIASAACNLAVDETERILSVSLAVGGLSDRPVRLTKFEKEITGRKLSELDIDRVAGSCEGLAADGALHASADFKRQVAKTLVRRLLRRSIETVRNETSQCPI